MSDGDCNIVLLDKEYHYCWTHLREAFLCAKEAAGIVAAMLEGAHSHQCAGWDCNECSPAIAKETLRRVLDGDKT